MSGDPEAEIHSDGKFPKSVRVISLEMTLVG